MAIFFHAREEKFFLIRNRTNLFWSNVIVASIDIIVFISADSCTFLCHRFSCRKTTRRLFHSKWTGFLKTHSYNVIWSIKLLSTRNPFPLIFVAVFQHWFQWGKNVIKKNLQKNYSHVWNCDAALVFFHKNKFRHVGSDQSASALLLCVYTALEFCIFCVF